jgi:hypothetical protein
MWALGAVLFGALVLLVWIASSNASPLQAALIMLGLELALLEKWRPAGFTFALAALCGLEAIIPGLAVLFLAATRGRAPRFAAGWLVPLATALVAVIAYYGPNFWEGLVGARLTFSGASGPAALLTGAAAILLVRHLWGGERMWTVVGGLAVALYGAALTFSGAAADLPAFIPFFVPALLLVWLLLREWRLPRIVLAACGALAVAATIVSVFLAPARRPALAPEVASAAFITRAQAITVQRTPDQTVIALDGAFQPELRRMLERGDRRSILIRYLPDLLQNEERDFAWAASADLEQLGYVPLDGEPPALWNGAWKRTAPVAPFEEHAIGADFGPDVHLTGFALDVANAHPGGYFRLRLDWLLARPATRSIFAEMRLARGAETETFTLKRDEIEPSVLRAGPWSTYHAVNIPPGTAPGDYALDLAVIINNGTAGVARLGQITVAER